MATGGSIEQVAHTSAGQWQHAMWSVSISWEWLEAAPGSRTCAYLHLSLAGARPATGTRRPAVQCKLELIRISGIVYLTILDIIILKTHPLAVRWYWPGGRLETGNRQLVGLETLDQVRRERKSVTLRCSPRHSSYKAPTSSPTTQCSEWGVG